MTIWPLLAVIVIVLVVVSTVVVLGTLIISSRARRIKQLEKDHHSNNLSE